MTQLAANQKRERRMTLGFAVVCAVLLAVGWYVATNMRGNEPTTLDAVGSEVLAGIDEIQSSLPASAIVSSTDKTAVSACPDGSDGQQFEIGRTITVTDTFDHTVWLRQLSERYEAREGWYAASRTVGSSERLAVKIVAPSLLIYRVTNNSASHGRQVLISSESRCTVPVG